MRRGIVPQGTFESSPQYEVLGMKQKDTAVPQGTIEILGFGIARGSATANIGRSSRSSCRRRFAVARPSLCGRAVARRAKVAS
jgi:hypothetical protein